SPGASPMLASREPSAARTTWPGDSRNATTPRSTPVLARGPRDRPTRNRRRWLLVRRSSVIGGFATDPPEQVRFGVPTGAQLAGTTGCPRHPARDLNIRQLQENRSGETSWQRSPHSS